MKSKRFFAGLMAAGMMSGSVLYAADELPARPEFTRYQPMMDRSPFAVATAVAPPPVVSNFAKDLYIANAAHSPNGDLVTVASSADKNLKLYLTTAEPVEGYSISNVEWSDHVGETKATISKDGQFATITFNQALLSSGLAANGMPQPAMMQPPIPAANFNGFNNAGNSPNMIKPAPIPMLPTPQPRARPVIRREQAQVTPAPAEEE